MNLRAHIIDPIGKVDKSNMANLEKKLRKIDSRLRGKLGVGVVNLENGERIFLRENQVFPTASLIKVQIMAALLEQVKAGKKDLKRKLRVQRRHMVGGSGILREMSPGVEVTVNDLMVLMIILSDNLATNMIIDHAGLNAINESIRSWGYEKTVLNRKINFHRGPDDPKYFGVTTPAETTDLLARIARRKLLGKKYDEMMENVMSRQKYDTGLPRLLPKSGTWKGDEPLFNVAHKTGSIDCCRIDCGIITSPEGRFVVSAFTKGLKDQRYHPDNEGLLAIAEVSRLSYDYMRKSDR